MSDALSVPSPKNTRASDREHPEVTLYSFVKAMIYDAARVAGLYAAAAQRAEENPDTTIAVSIHSDVGAARKRFRLAVEAIGRYLSIAEAIRDERSRLDQ